MLLQKVKIKSFCVLKDVISMNISIEDNRSEVVEELKMMQLKEWRYSIESSIFKDNSKELESTVLKTSKATNRPTLEGYF